MDPIYPGNVVRVSTHEGAGADLTGGFRNIAGALTDPTTVRLLWRRHGEATTTWQWTSAVPGVDIVKEATGLFHADITVAEPGLHEGRWEGTGAVIAAIEFTFSVESLFVAGAP